MSASLIASEPLVDKNQSAQAMASDTWGSYLKVSSRDKPRQSHEQARVFCIAEHSVGNGGRL
ncbi:hypothetical protein EMIT0P171_10291 [Pseudomonas sp. IT-P171]